jgi:hypothetical protein
MMETPHLFYIERETSNRLLGLITPFHILKSQAEEPDMINGNSKVKETMGK